MNNSSAIRLNSNEIGSLWQAYLNDDLAAKVIMHFLENVNDESVRGMLNEAYNISNSHKKDVAALLTSEGAMLPVGFSDNDVYGKAPRLYSDTFYLFYLANMSIFGMTYKSLAFYHAARSDARAHFSNSVKQIIDFYGKLAELMLTKGVFLRSPIVEVNKETDYIDKKDFFAGIFKEPRPLLLVEIGNIFTNIITCLTGRSLVEGFAQVAESEELRRYFARGKDLLDEHMEFLTTKLKDGGIPVPSSSDMAVTASKQAPFSDKLMLYHTSAIAIIHMRNISDAIIGSQRRDLTAAFARLSVETAGYAADGMDIMIRNGWMEQPPRAINHRELVGV